RTGSQPARLLLGPRRLLDRRVLLHLPLVPLVLLHLLLLFLLPLSLPLRLLLPALVLLLDRLLDLLAAQLPHLVPLVVVLGRHHADLAPPQVGLVHNLLPLLRVEAALLVQRRLPPLHRHVHGRLVAEVAGDEEEPQ